MAGRSGTTITRVTTKALQLQPYWIYSISIKSWQIGVAVTHPVSVDAFWIIQSYHVILLFLNEVEIYQEDARHRGHENGIRRHEVKKALGRLEDDPWAKCPST